MGRKGDLEVVSRHQILVGSHQHEDAVSGEIGHGAVRAGIALQGDAQGVVAQLHLHLGILLVH